MSKKGNDVTRGHHLTLLPDTFSAYPDADGGWHYGQPKDTTATYFDLRPLDPAVTDNINRMMRTKDVDKRAAEMTKIAQYVITGWHNIRHPDGREVPYKASLIAKFPVLFVVELLNKTVEWQAGKTAAELAGNVRSARGQKTRRSGGKRTKGPRTAPRATR